MRWIIIAIIAAILLFLLTNNDSGAMGLSADDFAYIIYALILLLLVGGGILSRYKGKISGMARDIAIWLFIFLIIGVGYSYRFEVKQIYNRFVGNLFTTSAQSVVGEPYRYWVNRDKNSHFIIDILTEGRTITYLVDTGATQVVLTPKAARAIGLNPEDMNYSRMISTANGITQAAPIQLLSMRIGDIEIRNVSALVALPGNLNENLLGMSFLNKLKSYQFRDDRLILEGYR